MHRCGSIRVDLSHQARGAATAAAAEAAREVRQREAEIERARMATSRAAAAAEVAASVAFVALSEVAQRSTLDSRSPMTVSCAPFAETHVSVASRDALS